MQVWITADGGGRPGSPLEIIAVSNVRPQILPIASPISIFSATRPTLTAGTTYRLVIGPADATTSDLTGPWVMKSNLAELVPACEIAVRQ